MKLAQCVLHGRRIAACCRTVLSGPTSLTAPLSGSSLKFKGAFSIDQAHPQRLPFRPRSSADILERETEILEWEPIGAIDSVASKDTHG